MGTRTKLYFAPMEGITGYTFRNAHHACYPGVDFYFSPFLSPNQHHAVNSKEKRDILPENNTGVPLIPQVLTNKAELFLAAARELKQKYGYGELNLNLGCPSKTVVSKGKGAGFLADTKKLKRFFEEVFEMAAASEHPGAGGQTGGYPRISVKTRLGMEEAEEFTGLLEIYNQYPLSELIIHPRVQKDYYKNTPRLEAFADAVRASGHSLCYNGDIDTVEDFIRIKELFPTVDKVMIGRGLLKNPALAQEIRAYEDCVAAGREWKKPPLDDKLLKKYHDMIFEKYLEQMSGDTNVLFKMKELWVYLAAQFPEKERQLKRVKKANKLSEYIKEAEELFL